MKSWVLGCFSAGLALGLSACDGSSSDNEESVSTSNRDVSTGTISGFGSVIVNGVRFDTSNALVVRSEQEVGEDALSLGMVVRVEGDIDGGVAERIEFSETLKGPVDGIEGAGLTVMGQTVLTSGTTFFNDTNLDSLQPGDIVEVSGMRNADDEIRATFLERKGDDARTFKVVGRVRQIDPVTLTFRIGGLTVDYSQAELDDLPNGQPTEGQLVEVKDENLAYVPGSLTLQATKVEAEGALAGGATPNGAQVEVEALVTAVNSPSEFVIGSVRVQVQASTKFEFGTRESIVVGSRIEVEGTFDDNGVLQATKIEFDDDDAEIQGFVNAVHPFDNTIELQGFEIQINGETEFEFDEDDLSTLSLDTIQPGDFLEVEGFVGSDGVFVVTHLEREDD